MSGDLLELVAETVRSYRVAMHDAEGPVGPDTALFGAGGVLDSIGLVSVVVELEQKVSDLAGRDVSLMNDRALSRGRSPFRTVRTLAEYAAAEMARAGSA
jgi:acyl carrier protein